MKALPLADPGTPDTRSAARFLLWVARGQKTTLATGMAFGVVWMGTQALVPAALGRAIDAGVAPRDSGGLARWTLALLAIGCVQAVAGITRHRFAVTNWLVATYRVQQLLARHATDVGAALTRRTSAGEVVAVSTSDAPAVGRIMDVSARAAGAVVAFVLVAAILLSTSVRLGLVVLVGVPLLMTVVGALLRPLHRRQEEQRARVGRLTALGADTVTGLRVLRGVGGEPMFVRRYVEQSQRVRAEGVRVARVQALLDAAQVALPGVFVVAVTWLGARLTLAGSITVGELVAFYGYSAFLVTPLRTATEAADKGTRALIAARRIVGVLSVPPALTDPAAPAAEPPAGVPLADAASGLVVRPGTLTALVSDDPDVTAAIADRLGRHADGAAVTLGSIPLQHLPLDAVRRRVLVHDADPRLFRGRLREELDVTDRASEERVRAAISVAAAQDVLDALPGGLDAQVEERGRSFSGGQRQRLALARSVVADPEILVLVEPTSAVDAHTEARIAQRLAEHRAGRTTVVVTASPLLLDHCDQVALVRDGRVVATGRHRELMERPDYRAVVLRGEEDR
ncbi:MAG: ABC transporter ATP-binding protein/permease [Actinomycetota bacterium]|nr:ABC transporter ATP-binding protein/permease [Actinomycetota bacterium]